MGKKKKEKKQKKNHSNDSMDISRRIDVACYAEFRRINLVKNVLLFTSALPEEGKTFISLELAITTALKLGQIKPILFVDLATNGHAGAILTNKPDSKGIVNFLLKEEDSINNCIQPTEIPNLFVLPYGNSSPNFEPLRYWHDFASLINEKSKEYKIFIDSGSIFTSGRGRFDPAEIAQIADSTFIVLLTGKTPREIALRSKKDLEICGGVVESVIMNDRFVKSFRSELGRYLSWIEKIPIIRLPVRYVRARLGLY